MLVFVRLVLSTLNWLKSCFSLISPGSTQCCLKKHLGRILDQLLEGIEPIGTDRTIDNTMITAECDSEEAGVGECIAVAVPGHNAILNASDCEDGGLRRVDHSRELFDAKAAQVRNLRPVSF